MSEKVNLLDVLTQDRQLPDGYDAWAIKSTRADLTTKNDFRWPYPGNATERFELDAGNMSSCPARAGDGVCVALDWRGMASGGFPARTLLLVAYRKSEAVSDEPGKLRVPQAFVVELVDGERLVRGHGKNADLSRADLYRADLSGADLSGADLSGADLSGADLRGADLSGAILYGAILYGANLSVADLSGANLSRANLSGANLSGADLSGADLSGADLRVADLSGAILYGAILYGADLSGANLPFDWDDVRARDAGGFR